MDNFIITTLIALLGIAITFAFSYIAFRQREKRESKIEGKNSGVILSDIGYIKAGVDDLKRDVKETSQNVTQLKERITRCEESTKQAHKRIDEIKCKEEKQ